MPAPPIAVIPIAGATGSMVPTVAPRGPRGREMPGGPTFIQSAAPAHSGPYLWWQTGLGDGTGITLWIEDGQ